jgi:transcriptional regulator with XRE-family HTH domain
MRSSKHRTTRQVSSPLSSSPAKRRATAQGIRERLRQLIREDFGNVQAAFAERCGFDPPRVSGWLSGHLPRADHLVGIAVATGVSLDWLLVGAGSKEVVHAGESRDKKELEEDLTAVFFRSLPLELRHLYRLGEIDSLGVLVSARDVITEEARAWGKWHVDLLNAPDAAAREILATRSIFEMGMGDKRKELANVFLPGRILDAANRASFTAFGVKGAPGFPQTKFFRLTHGALEGRAGPVTFAISAPLARRAKPVFFRAFVHMIGATLEKLRFPKRDWIAIEEIIEQIIDNQSG